MEPFDCNTTVTIGVELGAKVSSDLEGVVFEADKVFEAELSARGETSVTLGAKRGVDTKGIYTEMYADFGGVVAYVTAKVKVWKGSMGVENRSYTLVDPKPDLIKKKYYIVE